MKAVVLTRPCAAHALRVSEVPTPQARPGWALVKIRAFGINRAEVYTRSGFSPSVRLPRIIGIECVGEVAELAPADAGCGLVVGQPVVSLMNGLGRQFDGSYAEYALIPIAQTYPVPHPHALGWDWPTLAAVPETWFTAWGSLAALRMPAGEAKQSLLIRGGSSACGLAALQLAARMGLAVTSTTRNVAHADKIRAMGAQALIDDGALADHYAARFDKALELVGAATLRDTLRCLRPGGVACFTGVLGGWALERFEPIEDIPTGCYLTSFHSDSVSAAAVTELFAFIARHRIPIAAPTVFALHDIARAHALMESNQAAGKIVVVNDE